MSWITLAPPAEFSPLRTMAGRGLISNFVIRRVDDHFPYNWLAEREDMRLGRLTLYGWLDGPSVLITPLIEAILRLAPYLCTTATGVLLDEPKNCSRGHFWVSVVQARPAISAFSRGHDLTAANNSWEGHDGDEIADARTGCDHHYYYSHDTATGLERGRDGRCCLFSKPHLYPSHT